MTERAQSKGLSTRVSGHGLLREGRVLTQSGWGSGPGKGKCSCGAESGSLPTTAARQRWHREHKLAVLDVIQHTAPDGGPQSG